MKTAWAPTAKTSTETCRQWCWMVLFASWSWWSGLRSQDVFDFSLDVLCTSQGSVFSIGFQGKPIENSWLPLPSTSWSTQVDKKKPNVRSLPSASQTFSSAPMRLVVAGQSQIPVTYMLAHGQPSGNPFAVRGCLQRLDWPMYYGLFGCVAWKFRGLITFGGSAVTGFVSNVFLCSYRLAVFAQFQKPATKADVGCWTNWLLIMVWSTVSTLVSARCCSKKPEQWCGAAGVP